MSSQASNGCGHFGHLRTHFNRHSIDIGWVLTLGTIGGFLLILLVQAKPAFPQIFHLLILGIGEPEVVSIVHIMYHKALVAIGNNYIIPLTIEHTGTTAAAATATTTTLPAITTSGLVATGRICWQNITATEFTAFR